MAGRRRLFLPLAGAGLALLLAACSDDNELPGQGYLPPSEVTQSQSIPLVVPPDFGERPSSSASPTSSQGDGGETTLAESQPSQTDALSGLDLSTGETALLTQADVQQADPTIRRTLDRENAIYAGDPAFVDKLLFGSFPSGGTSQAEQGPAVAEDVQIQQQPPDQQSWLDQLVNFF
jgi:hypothetical protein